MGQRETQRCLSCSHLSVHNIHIEGLHLADADRLTLTGRSAVGSRQSGATFITGKQVGYEYVDENRTHVPCSSRATGDGYPVLNHLIYYSTVLSVYHAV